MNAFPIKSESEISSSLIQIINFPSGYKSLNYCGLFMVIKYDSSNFEKKISELEMIKKIKILANIDTVNYSPLEKKKKYSCKITKIPNLYDGSTDLDSLISEKDSICYVFDSERGKFLKDKTIYSNISQNNENGFSNGAFVFSGRKLILYWIIIW